MKTPLIASAITSGLILYILRGQSSSIQIGNSAAVGLGTNYAMSQIPEESKTSKHVDIDPTTNCFFQDAQYSGLTYACIM